MKYLSYLSGWLRVCAYSVWLTNLFLSIPLKPGPSEPRLENQEEIEADSTTQEAKEQGFVPEEEFSDVSHSFVITL